MNFVATNQVRGVLGVDTHQIPVPGGDCAIILLLDNPPMAQRDINDPDFMYYIKQPLGDTHTDQKLGTVLRAVLLDGGHDALGGNSSGSLAAQNILKTINDIQVAYHIANYPGEEGLKFDAWIVTHWDRDHYCGALHLFWDNTPHSVDGVQQRNRFIRYDANGNALTTLYCPTWTTYTLPHSDKKARGHHKILRGTVENGATRWSMYLPPRDKPRAILEYAEDDYSRMEFSGDFGKVVANSSDLLGLDFFTGRSFSAHPPGPAYGAINSAYRIRDVCERFRHGFDPDAPTYGLESYSLSADENVKYPVLLCVGAEGNVMGCKTVPITAGTGDNYVSIMVLLIWIPRIPDGPMHVSLFAGGDAHMATEDLVIDFLQGHCVEVIKAGHHGARTSTSANLLKSLQPNHFIISAGHEYGHPSRLSLSYSTASRW